jgi:hypothetical protein
MTNGSPEPTLIVPPARDGHRRSFSEADKRRIVEQAAQPIVRGGNAEATGVGARVGTNGDHHCRARRGNDRGSARREDPGAPGSIRQDWINPRIFWGFNFLTVHL